MKPIVKLVHDAEDKYTPVGSKPSVSFIPNDAPELIKIRNLITIRSHQEIDNDIAEGLRRRLTIEEIVTRYDVSKSSVYRYLKKYGKKARKNESAIFDVYDVNDKRFATGTICELSEKLGIPENTLRNHRSKSYQKHVSNTPGMYYLKRRKTRGTRVK